MNTPLYLGLSILEFKEIVIYEFYDYVKPKYGEKSKLYYMDRNSFIVYIKSEYIYKDIAKYVQNRFDTSNYELANEIIYCIKQIAKTYSHLAKSKDENKKAKGTKSLKIMNTI